MPSNEIDELYVTLRFREELGETIDDIDDEVDDLERSLQRSFSGMEEDVEETTNEVSTLRRRLEALDGRSVEIDSHLDDSAVQAQLRALDAKTVDVEVQADPDSSLRGGPGGGRSRASRLPGELGRAVSFLSRLGPATQASIAGVTALTGALAGAGGLSAAAVVAASKTGVLTDEIEALKARGKGAARDFAEEFSPVLKSDVFPTLRSLIGLVRASDSALAEFTSDTFDALRQLKQLQESGALGRGLIGGPLAAIPGDQPYVPDGFGLSALLSAVPEEGATSKAQGLADRISNALREVQQKLEKGRKRFSVEGLFGVDRASTLQERISLLEQLRDKLIKVRASTDLKKVPGMWPKLDRKIQDIQQSLEEYRQKLQDVQKQGTDAVNTATNALTVDAVETARNANFVEAFFSERDASRLQRRIETALQVQPSRMGRIMLRNREPESSRALSSAREAGLISEFQDFSDVFGGEVDQAFTRLATRLENINQRPFLPQAAKARKRVRSVVAVVRRLQQQGELLSEEALRGFLNDLDLTEEQVNRIIDRLEQARKLGKRMRRTLKRAAADLTVQVGVDLGKSIGAAIGLSKIQRLKKELSTLQLRQRRQRLRERISEATSPLQAKALQKQLELVSARLKKARSEAGAFGQAFKNVLGSVQDSIAKVLRQMAFMAALRGIFTGNPLQILAGLGLATGSGLVSSLDSGGHVLSDGIAKVHEGEQVIPAEMVSRLQGVIPKPEQLGAAAAGQARQVTFKVEGELRQRGTEMRATLRESETLRRRTGTA